MVVHAESYSLKVDCDLLTLMLFGPVLKIVSVIDRSDLSTYMN